MVQRPASASSANRSSNTESVAHSVQPLIAKTATIELLVTNVDEITDAVGNLARSDGGDVFDLSAQGSSADRSTQSADMTIRIPAARFDGAMSRLEQLGKVRSRGVKAEDLTGNLTDSSARLRNLQRTEDDILKIMDRSGNVAQIMDVENQLSSVREQIETLQADLASMRGRVAYSTIEVQLSAEAKSTPAEPGALAQLRNAFTAATHSLADTTVALLAAVIWIVVFVPYVLAIAFGFWVLRLALRKYAVRS